MQCGNWEIRFNCRAKFTNSALPKQKATSLPNWRSLVGVPVLFLVGKYKAKEGINKITHVPSVLAVGVKSATSPFFSAIFVNMIPGVLIARVLRYRTSHGSASSSLLFLLSFPFFFLLILSPFFLHAAVDDRAAEPACRSGLTKVSCSVLGEHDESSRLAVLTWACVRSFGRRRM